MGCYLTKSFTDYKGKRNLGGGSGLGSGLGANFLVLWITHTLDPVAKRRGLEIRRPGWVW